MAAAAVAAARVAPPAGPSLAPGPRPPLQKKPLPAARTRCRAARPRGAAAPHGSRCPRHGLSGAVILPGHSPRPRRLHQHASGTAAAAAGGGGGGAKAAFFDVDGTIVKSNVVWPYVITKLDELAWHEKLWWVPMFAVQAIVYLAVDRVDRTAFQRIFFRNYAGYRADSDAAAMSAMVYESYLKPKTMEGAVQRVERLKAEGFQIVLVTGGLDFLVAPLVKELGADAVVAAELEVEGGVFTGEVRGKPVSDAEKGVRMRRYAEESGVDLSLSHAYGDSYADMGMLEAVGSPHAVRPSGRLAKVAEERGWPVLEWE